MQSFKSALLVAFCAFMGGVVSEQFLHPKNGYAEEAINATRDIMGTNHTILDKDGMQRWRISADAGEPIQNYSDKMGKARLVTGLYGGIEGPGSDAGIPMVLLSDSMNRQRLLLRLAQGTNESPLLVMKDSRGKDRILMGNSFTDEGEEPFLVYFDRYGVKHNVFGKF
jgi:hypothetical protein